MTKSMFAGRRLLIATKHNKEKVIAPLIERELGVKCFVSRNFDTDILGTFTGEVERKTDPITTLRNKCLMAMELNNSDLAVANEGSFGPHPQLYFAHANHELVILIDKKNDIELIASEVSMSTNFSGKSFNQWTDLLTFSESANFPSHAIILRKERESNDDIFKGITTVDDLKSHYTFLFHKYGAVYAETDMRAMHNPTRMLVIESAFKKLISKINSLCPKCNAIGFEIKTVKSGLPCSLCGFKTKSTLSHVYGCNSCDYKEEKKFPNGVKEEDPMYCDICNP